VLVGIPIPDPFSQSQDLGLGNFESRDPGRIMGAGGMISKNVIFEYMGLY